MNNPAFTPNQRPGGPAEEQPASPVVWQLWFGFFASAAAFCAIGYWLIAEGQQVVRLLPENEKFLWLVFLVAIGLGEFFARQLRAGQPGLVRYMLAFAVAELISIAGVALGIWAGSTQPVFFFGGASLLVFLRLALAIR